jgi:hypothetical protein
MSVRSGLLPTAGVVTVTTLLQGLGGLGLCPRQNSMLKYTQHRTYSSFYVHGSVILCYVAIDTIHRQTETLSPSLLPQPLANPTLLSVTMMVTLGTPMSGIIQCCSVGLFL